MSTDETPAISSQASGSAAPGDRARVPITVLDRFDVWIGDQHAFFVLAGAPERAGLILLPVRRQLPLGSELSEIEAAIWPEGYCQLLNALACSHRIVTARGDCVTFDDWMQSSRGEPFRDFSPSGIYSTNAVATVRRGQHKLVHKAYLLAHRSNREHDLGRSRCNMGAILGRYCYVERLTGSVHLLGTLRAYVEGATLDVPLRESFRHCVCSPSTSHVATEYEQSLMKQVAVGLLKLQREISESEPHGTSSITRILADATRRCEDLAKLVETDPELTLPLRHRVIAAMRAMIQPPAPEQSCIDPGGMHGDLHFGHIILSKHGVHFIDFENFDIAADGVSTPWKDVVSLARAFEYFSHDEVCRVAVRLGNDEHSIAKRLVAEWPRLPVQLLDLIQRSRSWRLAIWQVFIGAYGAHSASVPNPKCLRLLYVQRLLQELQYNYAHSRSFYKWFDLYYILQNTMGEPCTL